MAKTRQAGSPPWSRDELILALDLYLRFAGSPPGKAAREIVELSNILNQIGTEITARTAKYRNPNGVYMKIMNFRRFDPHYLAQGKKGLQRGGKWTKKYGATLRRTLTSFRRLQKQFVLQ